MNIATEYGVDGKKLVIVQMEGRISFLEIAEFEKKLWGDQLDLNTVVLIDFTGIPSFKRYAVESYLQVLKKLSSQVPKLVFIGLDSYLKLVLAKEWMKEKIIWEKNTKTAFKHLGRHSSICYHGKSKELAPTFLKRIFRWKRRYHKMNGYGSKNDSRYVRKTF